jgi:23S rRNA (adenine2503-C2)-methyltransferase
MENLYGKTLTELETLTGEKGWPRFTAGQIAGWLYRKRVDDFNLMSNLPKEIRNQLAESHICKPIRPERVVTANDGTRKYLFRFYERLIETAMIPDNERNTLCMSTQSGCRMGCLFCSTGRQGFGGSLSPGEMLSQLTGIDEADRITNIVVMGMGEPLDNLDNLLKTLEILVSEWGFGLSPGRITVSTIGIPENLKILLDKTRVNLALSLHDPFPEGRELLIPSERRWPLSETLTLLKNNPAARERKITIEYILLSGVNDSDRHAIELNRIINGIKAKVNLIPFNSAPGSPYTRPDEGKVDHFRTLLRNKGLTVTVRKSRGGEINAACGLLSTTGMNSAETL